MAADGSLLQGEVVDNPEKEDRDIEKLLVGFFKALLDEQRAPEGPDSAIAKFVEAKGING